MLLKKRRSLTTTIYPQSIWILDRFLTYSQIKSIFSISGHGTYIRWWLRTCRAHVSSNISTMVPCFVLLVNRWFRTRSRRGICNIRGVFFTRSRREGGGLFLTTGAIFSSYRWFSHRNSFYYSQIHKCFSEKKNPMSECSWSNQMP